MPALHLSSQHFWKHLEISSINSSSSSLPLVRTTTPPSTVHSAAFSWAQSGSCLGRKLKLSPSLASPACWHRIPTSISMVLPSTLSDNIIPSQEKTMWPESAKPLMSELKWSPAVQVCDSGTVNELQLPTCRNWAKWE